MAASRKFRSIETLRESVRQCVERYADRADRIVVGLSGGIDSVVLLHAMHSLQYSVSAIHVHHGLSTHADAWMEFCQRTCSDMGIVLRVDRVQVERGSKDGLEAAARRVRHAVLDGIDANWIALGHHRDDRAETLLFNLLRGTGVGGAGALAERRGRILRPLLSVGRDEIVFYARQLGLAWVDDESNADTRYSRNFLRNDVMPLLRTRFPAASERFASAAERFREASQLLDELAVVDLATTGTDFPLAVAQLRELSECRARNILRFLLKQHGIGIASEQRLTEFLRQCLSAKQDRHPAVTFGQHVLRRKAGMIVLTKRA